MRFFLHQRWDIRWWGAKFCLPLPGLGEDDEVGKGGDEDHPDGQDAAQAVLRGGGDVAVGIAFAFEAAVAVGQPRLFRQEE